MHAAPAAKGTAYQSPPSPSARYTVPMGSGVRESYRVLVTEPLQYQDFELAMPTGPGLGVELDEDRLRFFQRDGERRSISTAPAQAGR
jgi:L-alanine-DL-glutamate epimerase-like enolase superfamily enzyme